MNTGAISQQAALEIEQALQHAIAQHHEGQFEKAQDIYLAILKIIPNHPDANYRMGLLALQKRNAAAGLPYLLAALNANPASGQYWLSYVEALHQAGQLEDARNILTLARNQGLQGDEVDALASRLNSGPPTDRQPPHHDVRPGKPSDLPISNARHDRKSKPTDKPHKAGTNASGSKGQSPDPIEISALLSTFKAGRLTEAAALAKRMTVRFPDYGLGWKVLGVASAQLGKSEEALTSLRRAAALSPRDVEAQLNLGSTLHELGQLNDAETIYRRVLEMDPNNAVTYCRLGAILHDLGRLEDAEENYRRGLLITPDWAEAQSNLGYILHDLGRPEEAEATLRKALEIDHECAEAHCTLGNTLHDMGRLDEAEISLRCALKIKPDLVEAHCNLGNVLRDMFRYAEAEASYRRAIQLRPGFAQAHCNLGTTLKDLGQLDQASACYRRARELGINAAYVKDALMLPAIMGTRRAMLASRARFTQNLDTLVAGQMKIEDPLKEIGETNFYLAYHGMNDLDLQVKVAKFYEGACPSLTYTAPHCVNSKPDCQRKIKVGFFSKYLYGHSVSHCYSKIIESVSMIERFEIFLISNNPIDEAVYSGFRGQRMQVPNSLARTREILAALKLDFLVYLDIGMEPFSYFLAFSRLARAQCVLGGHPVTTGIGNMDYFLSADVMEPSDGDMHYSEKLIRLPRPLVYFPRPTLPAIQKTRLELNLPEAKHLYMCPMRLQKLHPDFDEAIAGILKLDCNAVIVLFEDEVFPHWKATLTARFEISVPMEVRDRIMFMPWLKQPTDFISAISAADVVLDPFHFGIGSTAMLTSVTGTPLVTRAGEFMRGRVGAGYCAMLDVRECIANKTEEYIRIAVEIANNPALRERIRSKTLKNNSDLYDNLQPVNDLINFFDSVSSGWHAN